MTTAYTAWNWTDFQEEQQGSGPNIDLMRGRASSMFLDLLQSRKILQMDSLQKFLNPELTMLPDVALLPGAQNAAKIIAKNVYKGKKILIWGDYDTDGVSASTVVEDFLDFFHVPRELFKLHLPNRFTEGYGINLDSLEKELETFAPDLIITVDCGITAHSAAEKIKTKGIELVITDHHLPAAVLPDATVLCDPYLSKTSPWRGICGTAVVWLVLREAGKILSPLAGQEWKAERSLDLVALGQIADKALIQGAGRILTMYGMREIMSAERPGIQDMKIQMNLRRDSPVTSQLIAFFFAPRINAAGRLEDPSIAQKALSRSAPDYEECTRKLTRLSEKRKRIESTINRDAIEIASTYLQNTPDAKALLVGGTNWHAGIIGIVASRLQERFGLPASVYGYYPDKELCIASARANTEINCYEMLSSCSEYLVGFGGHKGAAGFKFKPEFLPLLRVRMNQYMDNLLQTRCAEERHTNPDATLMDASLFYLGRKLAIDMELSPLQAQDKQFLNELTLLEPFGEGNDQPIFISPPCVIKERHLCGAPDSGHLRLTVAEADNMDKEFTMYAWRMESIIPSSLTGIPLRLAYRAEINTSRFSKSHVAFTVIDYRHKDFQIEARVEKMQKKMKM